MKSMGNSEANESSFETPPFNAFLKQPANDVSTSSTLTNQTIQSENIQESPRLAPLRTPRSNGSQSSMTDMDFLMRSSNESFGKIKLGNLGLQDSASSSQSSPRDHSELKVMDINDLAPANELKTKSRISLDIDISTDSSNGQTKNSSKSSSLEVNRFLKKSSEIKTASESSVGSASHSSRKSRSRSSSRSHTRPKTPSQSSLIRVSKTKGQEASSEVNVPIQIPSVPIQVQIEQKTREEEKRIENELIQIQLDLQDKRQEKYEEIMDEHEKEMYRMELEVNRINGAQLTEQENRVAKVRKEFEEKIEIAIQDEKNKNEKTLEGAIEGLKATLKNQSEHILKDEQKIIDDKRLALVRESEAKIEQNILRLKDEIEHEENKKVDLLANELNQKKNENQRLQDQNLEMFGTLRQSRREIEENNQKELLEIEEKHQKTKKEFIEKNQKEISEIEKKQLDKLSKLQEKFENQLEKKKHELETKRAEFDTRIEAWEADHSTRKMNWASVNHNRKQDFENNSVFYASQAAVKQPGSEDEPLSRKDLDTSQIVTPKNFETTKGNSPHSNPANLNTSASDRLREYMNGLEKKLETFSNLITSDDPLTSTKKPLSYKLSEQHNIYSNSAPIPTYNSERWRAYYGTDFKYVPARTELDQRLTQDYRYRQMKQNIRKIEDITS